MQHEQRSHDSSQVNRHHHGGVLGKSKLEEVCRDNVNQVRDDQWQAGGIGNKTGGHHKSQGCCRAETQRQQHGNHDGRQDQCSTIIGEQRGHHRTQQNNPAKQLAATAFAPAGNVQGGPFKETRLIQQQADDDHRNKGGRRIPDDVPDHRNISEMNNPCDQRQACTQHGAPANTQPSGLPDNQG
ncbi:Zn-dependent proteases [Klebsiella pneumoniae]|nr:Zn-dependent proteases [Klebsiella pneumoniae]